MIQVFKKIMRRIHMARLESELRNMSDRTLADIGIARSEIPEVVRAVFAEQPAQQTVVANSNAKSSMAA